MTDILDSVGEGLGQAFDFLTPTTTTRGAGWSFGDLLNDAVDVAKNTTLGAITALPDVLQSDTSWKNKLFVGGMVAAGATGSVLGARQLAASRKLERSFAIDTVAPAVRRTSDEAMSLGLSPRFMQETPETRLVLRDHPGIRTRSVDVLAAQDNLQTASAIMDPAAAAVPELHGRSAGVFGGYVNSLTDMDPAARFAAAQLDFAKVDTAFDTGILRVVEEDRKGLGAGYLNADLESVWNKFKAGTITDDEAARLVTYVRQIGDATRQMAEPDFHMGLTERVQQLVLTPDGAVPSIQSQIWDRTTTLMDPEVRSARLTQLNVRAWAGRGQEIFETLLEVGLVDHALRNGRISSIPPETLNRLVRAGVPGLTMENLEAGILPSQLDIGPGWYPIAGSQIDDTLIGLPPTLGSWVTKEKLTAAVSFSSEAEKWEGNIALAVRALGAASVEEVKDAGFQAWIKTPEFRSWAKGNSPAPNLMVTRADGTTVQLADMFNEIHDSLTNASAAKAWKAREAAAKVKYNKQKAKLKDQGKKSPWKNFGEFFTEEKPTGVQLSKVDLAKILRLAVEEADDVFRSTQGRKQKSFYRNLLGDFSVVTVDRHQHDAFFGLATSSDFKILEKNDLDDSVYDLIQDTVFRITDDRRFNDLAGMDLTPSDVQGVIWEVWRILKDDHLHHSNQPWQNGIPFSIPEADGSPNKVFQALTGESDGVLRDAINSKDPSVPYLVGSSNAGLYSMPDETLGIVAPVDPTSAGRLRHLQPAVSERPGVAHWAPSRPRPVADLERHVQRVIADDPDIVVEQWSNAAWPGGHPALRPGNVVMVEVPMDVPADTFAGLGGNVIDPGMPATRTLPKTLAGAEPPAGIRTATIDEFMEARREWERRATADGSLKEFGTSPLEDEPAYYSRHKLYLNDDGTAGFAIDPDGDLQQVFNGSGVRGYGAQMVDYAISEGARKLDAYDLATFDPEASFDLPSYYERFGFEVVDPPDYMELTAPDSKRVAWDPQYDKKLHRPVGPPIVYMALPVAKARVTGNVRKLAIEIPPSGAATITDIADMVESKGGKVDVIYTNQGAPPEGWTQVREHLYDDGVNTAVTRTLDPELDSYHGVGGWVRAEQGDRLAKASPDGRRAIPEPDVVDRGGTLVFGGSVGLRPTEPAAGRAGAAKIIRGTLQGTEDVYVLDRSNHIPVLVQAPARASHPVYLVARDGKLVINVPSKGSATEAVRAGETEAGVPKDDMTPMADKAYQSFNLRDAAEIKDSLLEMGVPAETIEIRVGPDSIATELVAPQSVPGRVATIHNWSVPLLKRTSSPLPEFRTRFNLDVDPAWRSPDGVVHLAGEEFSSAVRNLTDLVYSDHLEMMRRADLRKIGVTELYVDGEDAPLDLAAWAASGHGGTEIALNGKFLLDPAGYFADVGDNYFALDHRSVESILAHEYGHTMHYGLQRSFSRKGNMTEWEKKNLAPYLKDRETVISELSEYAATDTMELVAESISEVLMSPNPRPLAQEVYKMVVEQFHKNTKHSRITSIFGMFRGNAA